MAAKKVSTTQSHIDIVSIKDGLVYTKSGSLKAVVSIVPMNFALKSEEDQDTIIGQFQSFLNALTFPIQIVVQSRRIDVSDYLKKLGSRVENEGNELLRLQGQDYIDFISRLTTLANIMDKKFYIVVGYDPKPVEPKSGLLSLFVGKPNPKKLSFEPAALKKYQEELTQRLNAVQSGLQAMGMETKQLDTQGLIEMYYGVYNPDESNFERLSEAGQLQSDVIHGQARTNQPNSTV